MNQAGIETTSWFAATVKPQHEKTVAEALRAKGLENFLPLYRDRRRWSDRLKEVELPLFPGYVFCRFEPRDRTAVMSTPGIRSIVGFGRVPAAVSDTEIDSIRAMVTCGFPVAPWPFLRAGQKIVIERGPLSGLEGILLQIKESWRVVVSVPLLQRSVSVEVDRDVISVVKPVWMRTVVQPARNSPAA